MVQEVCAASYISVQTHVFLIPLWHFDIKAQLVKISCRGYIKQNVTKSHMPKFITTNTKLQDKLKSVSTADYLYHLKEMSNVLSQHVSI